MKTLQDFLRDARENSEHRIKHLPNLSESDKEKIRVDFFIIACKAWIEYQLALFGQVTVVVDKHGRVEDIFSPCHSIN